MVTHLGPSGFFEEVVTFTPQKSGRYFLVVKFIDIAEVQPGVCGIECTNKFTVTSSVVASATDSTADGLTEIVATVARETKSTTPT